MSETTVPQDDRSAPSDAAPRRINLALQGGGSHGAFAWGVLERLLEEPRIEIDAISATSAGAMNATVYAHGLATGGREGARTALEAFWHRVSVLGEGWNALRRSPWDVWAPLFGMREGFGLHAFEALTRMFSPYEMNPMNVSPLREALTGLVDFDRLRTSASPKLRLCATNVRTGKMRIFSNAEVTAEVVLASACLPTLFQAVEIEGEHFWDGGYMGNPAIYPLIYDTDTPDILIVHINPIVRPDLPRTAGEIVNRVNEVSFNSSLMREMRAIAFVTKLIDDGWLRPEYRDRLRRIYIHAIRTDELMGQFPAASKFDTDWRFLGRLRGLGHEAAGAWVTRHFGDLGERSTVDLRETYL